MPVKKTPAKKIKRYMLVDGNALVHRAFHAIQHLATKSGEPTNAVYGFTVILLNAIKDIKPTHIALTFDLAAPTFRHEQYKEYKATRVKAADELYQQIPRCKEVVRSLGISVYEKEGFEADDLLGTLATEIRKENEKEKNDNYEVLIVTGDLDTLQLVNDKVKIYTSRKGLSDVAIYDQQAIKERYGLSPEQMLDFKAIKGDPSDNIPGVTGIGEKGAADLVKEFGSLQNILANVDKLKEKYQKLFKEQKEQALMSYDLSRIRCDVPIKFDLPQYVFTEADYRETVRLFQELEFKSLVAKLPKPAASAEAESDPAKTLNQAQIKTRSNDRYILADTGDKILELAEQLAQQKEFCFDTETEGLGALDFDLVGLGISYEQGTAYYIPAGLLTGPPFQKIKAIFENPKIGKIAHNIKYDYLAMKRFGINTQNLFFDTMIAAYLLAPGSRSLDLDTLVFNEFGYEMQPIDELIGKGKAQISLKEVDVSRVCFYCCEDADYALKLRHLLLPRLQAEKLDKIFFEIEMPLIRILAEMEENGILLDTKLFAQLHKTVEAELKNAEARIFKLAGKEFNINSPAQMKVVLFEDMKINAGSDLFIKKNKSGLSTAAAELEKMRGLHPIIDEILNFRELAKLQSTYIDALPELVSKIDGRLHTNYNQTIAATGRLSSTNPNLQNIPVRSDGLSSQIRKGFVAAPGCKLVSIDYSQIELRVVAHLSGDPTMTRVFQNHEDIHAATAMKVYGISDPAKVSKEMRRDAKTINFGVLYGVSSFGLSERVSMSRAEAADFIKKYFQEFPGVKEYIDLVTAETHAKGYVENELGRKRYLPEINSSQFMVRAAAERAAINMPMQSLAADIIKLAMEQIAAKIDIQSKQIKLLLQVHDELVFEIAENKISEYAPMIREVMQNSYKLKVPLEVEIKVGDNWGEMKPL